MTVAKKTVDAASLQSYEGKLSKVYSSNSMDGPFHIIDVVQAEDSEKIQGLCGDDPGFYIEEICDPELVLLRDLDAPVGLICQECGTKREEILQAIVDWKKEVELKEAEKKAEADAKKLADEERKAKAKIKDEAAAKTPSPAEGEKKTASKSKGGKKKNGGK
jgi:hypothetical protein